MSEPRIITGLADEFSEQGTVSRVPEASLTARERQPN